MKTYKEPLFEKLISYENLETAIINSSKHKLDRAKVRKAVAHKEKIINRLQYLLKTKKFVMPKHTGEDKNDGIEQKKRIIVKPFYVYDLILQWAVVQVLHPIIMKGMYNWSCGSIVNRGGHYGKRYIVKYIKENPTRIKYVAKGDIHHFFESIDIERLKHLFKKIIRDKDMLWIIDLILDCNIVEYKGEMVNVGLPIGFYTSQYFANFYLQGLDHFIKEQLHMRCYVRYVDDFILLCNNKKELRRAMFEISKFLADLDLKLKSNHQVFRFDYINKNNKRIGRPIDFMGFKFYRDKTTIRRKTFFKAMRKFKKVSKLKIIDIHSARQVLCYTGYFKHTNSYKIFTEKVTPLVNIGQCKKIVSNYDKRKEIRNAIKLEKCREPDKAS